MANALIKQPSESRVYTMRFFPNMAAIDTISSITSVEATPSGLTLGTPQIVGQTVVVRVSSGTTGVRSHFTFKVVSSTGDNLEGDGWLLVQEK